MSQDLINEVVYTYLKRHSNTAAEQFAKDVRVKRNSISQNSPSLNDMMSLWNQNNKRPIANGNAVVSNGAPAKKIKLNFKESSDSSDSSDSDSGKPPAKVALANTTSQA